MSTILEAFLSKPRGSIATIKTKRELKVRKGSPQFYKTSTIQVKIGCDYANLTQRKENVINGLAPTEVQPLAYGEWDIFPYTIKHKDNIYLRCSVFNSANGAGEVIYTNANNEIVSKEIVEPYLLASERHDKSTLPVFNLKLENVLSVK